jgi:diphthine-ammonia ligase
MFIKSMSDFPKINHYYSEMLVNDIEPPVRACVATDLCDDVTVLLELVLHRPVKQQQMPPRDVMFVRSISHWAPANIAPYSQSVTVVSSFLV